MSNILLILMFGIPLLGIAILPFFFMYKGGIYIIIGLLLLGAEVWVAMSIPSLLSGGSYSSSTGSNQAESAEREKIQRDLEHLSASAPTGGSAP
jgi:hypothetical protein